MAVRRAAAIVAAPTPAAIVLVAFLSGIFASRLKVQLALLAWLQTPFAGKVWISLTHEVEHAGELDCRQAAEHYGWQDFDKHLALRDTGTCRVADRQGNAALANPSCHDRNHDVEERVVSAESQDRPDRCADGRGGPSRPRAVRIS